MYFFLLKYAKNQSILRWSNFPDLVENKPIDPWQQKKHHTVHIHHSSLIGRKNQAKFENDCISRNGHRINITQPNLMILVSFSSAEDVFSNDVKTYKTFSSQGTKKPPFRFLGHPVYK